MRRKYWPRTALPWWPVRSWALPATKTSGRFVISSSTGTARRWDCVVAALVPGGGGQYCDLGASLTFSDESHAIQAAIAGQGVALLSETLVKAELERGVLKVPFGPRLPGLRYQLVRHGRCAGHAALGQVAEWLRGAFADQGAMS
ncbi:LysR substrate-binding domain-containing protein [Halomonas sp. BC04]|uniref:LysR substrate-binding domain-containing protein n=1 Tax=Halomonas sp. BC04 TaxID=1403540 RepID=UPI003FA55BF2